MDRKRRNLLFRVLILAALGGAVITLLPHSSALTSNDLGYKSLCPFAPWSTLCLVGLAALLAAVQSYLSSQRD
ncbi:MAG: hypothetical protein ABI823_08040 [Bryobacteraceae bacterium]